MPVVKMKQATKTFKINPDSSKLIDAIFAMLKSPLLSRTYALYSPKFKIIEFDKATDFQDYCFTEHGFNRCFEAFINRIDTINNLKFNEFSGLDSALKEFNLSGVYGLDEFIDFLVMFFKHVGQNRLAKCFAKNKINADFRKAIAGVMGDIINNSQDCEPYYLFVDLYNQERYTLKSLIDYFQIRQQQLSNRLTESEPFKQRKRMLKNLDDEMDCEDLTQSEHEPRIDQANFEFDYNTLKRFKK